MSASKACNFSSEISLGIIGENLGDYLAAQADGLGAITLSGPGVDDSSIEIENLGLVIDWA